MQRRLSNPLLRRVQRHTRISTLFHTSPAESFLAENPSAWVRVLPVGLPAPVSDTAPVSDLVMPAVAPASAPVQTFPLPTLPAGAPAARVPAAPTPIAYPPASEPLAVVPPAPIPRGEAGKVEEESNWKRLQTIMRKHAEREQPAAQPEAGEPAQPASVEPLPAPVRETQAAPAGASPSAPVQRRPSLVQEFPSAPAARQAPPVPPLAMPGTPAETPVSSVPPPATVSASELPAAAHPASELRAASLPPPTEIPAAPAAQPVPSVQRMPEAPPALEPSAPSTTSLQASAALPSPHKPPAAAVPEAPAAQPAPTLQRQPAPEAPLPADEALPVSQLAPQASPSRGVEEREAPTVQIPRASLAGTPPVQRASAPRPATQPPAALPTSAAQEVRQPQVSQAAELPPDTIAPPPAPLPPVSAVPLEAIWGVQRLPASPEPSPAASAEEPGIHETPVVLPHDEHLGQILQSVASGLPSESTVELVTPRKPRPPAARPPSPAPPEAPVASKPEAVLPETPALQRQAVQTEPVVPSPAPVDAVPEHGEAAEITPGITPVPTEIGTLPSDLWSLIDQPAPVSVPVTVQPVPEAAPPRPYRQSALQRHVEAQATEPRPASPPGTLSSDRSPAGSAAPENAAGEEPEGEPGTAGLPVVQLESGAPADVIQRTVAVGEVVGEVTPPVAEDQPSSPPPNVEELAQRVYQEIRRRLAVEFERWRRG